MPKIDDASWAIFCAYLDFHRCHGIGGAADRARTALAECAGDNPGWIRAKRLREWASILTAAADKMDAPRP
jgi:hypothetical protein